MSRARHSRKGSKVPVSGTERTGSLSKHYVFGPSTPSEPSRQPSLLERLEVNLRWQLQQEGRLDLCK